MKISITHEDIRMGKPFDCRACPIALAIQREMGSFAVGGDGLLNHNLQIIRHWPKNALQPISDFIEDFDNGRPVRPFTFDLN